MNSRIPVTRTAVSDQPFTNTESLEVSLCENSPLNCASSSFHYYVARWYDPVTAHFTSADSIIPQPGNSGDWDRYAYVLYNPIRYIDPSGHFTEDEVKDHLKSVYGDEWQTYWDLWSSDDEWMFLLVGDQKNNFGADYGDVLSYMNPQGITDHYKFVKNGNTFGLEKLDKKLNSTGESADFYHFFFLRRFAVWRFDYEADVGSAVWSADGVTLDVSSTTYLQRLYMNAGTTVGFFIVDATASAALAGPSGGHSLWIGAGLAVVWALADDPINDSGLKVSSGDVVLTISMEMMRMSPYNDQYYSTVIRNGKALWFRTSDRKYYNTRYTWGN